MQIKISKHRLLRLFLLPIFTFLALGFPQKTYAAGSFFSTIFQSLPNESAISKSSSNEPAISKSSLNESAISKSSLNESAISQSAPNESAISQSAPNESTAYSLTTESGDTDTHRIVISKTDKNAKKPEINIINAESLFGRNFYPGYEKKTEILISNDTDSEIFTRWTAEIFSENELADALIITLCEGDKIIKISKLDSFDIVTGTVKDNNFQNYYLRLVLPSSSGNETKGSKADFSINVAISDKEKALTGEYSEDTEKAETENEEDAKKIEDTENTEHAGNNKNSERAEDSDNSGNEIGGDSFGKENGNNSQSSDVKGESSNQQTSDTDENYSNQQNTGKNEKNQYNYSKTAGSKESLSPSGQASGKSSGSSVTSFFGSISDTVLTSGDIRIYSYPFKEVTTAINDGAWEISDEKNNVWRYRLKDGKLIKNGFAYIQNTYSTKGNEDNWYYFDADGRLSTGWIKINGDEECWYYAHDISDGDRGKIETGFVKNEEDGRTYYLDTETAKMKTGWCSIKNADGTYDEYYFARHIDTYGQTWFFNTSFGRWFYKKLGKRPYGSMYINEKTPDGKYTDADGKLIR